MGKGGWWLGAWLLVVGCSSGGGQTGRGATGIGGSTTGAGGAPSQATDTNPMNPHVTTMPPASPNGPRVTGNTGVAGAMTAAAGATGAAGTNGAAGTTGAGATTGATGAAGATGFAGATGTTGTTGTAGVTGAVGTTGAAGDSGATGAIGAAGTGGTPAVQRSWPTVDCVGGPCAAPGVCVNLDFLFVACVPCGGNDQVCCPPYEAVDPFLGTCDPGLVCAHNPNFQSTPPTDVVQNVCQIPGMPPPADGGLNHERLKLFP